MAFSSDIQTLLDAWVGTAHRDYDSRVVFVARIRAYSLFDHDLEDLWVASRTYGTTSGDTPANQPMAAALIPPNVTVSVFKGDNFLHAAPVTAGDLVVLNERLDADLDPTGRTGRFDHWAIGYDFRQRLIDTYLGPLIDATDGSPAVFSTDFEPYFRGNIEEVSFRQEKIVFRVSPQGANWKAAIQTNFYGAGFDITIPVAYDISGDGTSTGGEWRKYIVWTHDNLIGIKQPVCLGEVYGMIPQRVSIADDVYQWDSGHGDVEGLIEVYEGALGSTESGPAYSEDDEIYGIARFVLDGGTPDKPLTFSGKGAKFLGKQLVTNTHDLEGTGWINAGLVITDDQTDPLGGTEAFLLNDDSGAAPENIGSAPYTIETDQQRAGEWVGSVFLKEGTSTTSRVQMFLNGTSTDETRYVDITWSSRSITAEETYTDGEITYDDGTWLRVCIRGKRETDIPDFSTISLTIYPAGYPASNTGTAYAYGPQLECMVDQPTQDWAGLYRRNATTSVIRYIDRPMLLVEHLLNAYQGYEVESLEWKSFAAWDYVSNYAAGLYVSHDQDLTFEDAYKRLMAPNAALFPKRNGLLAVGLIQEPYVSTADPDTIIDEGDIGALEERRIAPAYRVMVGYRPIQKKLGDNEFLGAATGDNKALHSEKTRWAIAEDRGTFEAFKDAREVRIETNLADEVDAQSLADAQLKVLRQERRHLRITQRKKFYRTDIGDRVSIKLNRYGYVDDGTILFGNDAVIEFDDDADVEKENPADGLPGIQTGLVDNPESESTRGRIEVWL